MSRELKILFGVSGGIAAYKASLAVRALRARGHQVRCALTRAGEAFVTPLTLEVLSGQPVVGPSPVARTGKGEEAHIEAAAWADVACVAPATAHTLAKLAAGLADDFLTTSLLAFDGRVVLAPAMHTAMWEKAATQRVCRTLEEDGHELVGPVEGPLASGEVGMGRMVEVEEIVAALERAGSEGRLVGRSALVSAGPTFEAVDPIRFLGNRSSGRMGFALAAELHRQGAEVTLVSGPVALATPPGVRRIDVRTADEMATAIRGRAGGQDLVVMAAAVADFRAVTVAENKLKKSDGVPQLSLVRTEDILAGLRDLLPRAVLVGFAAETCDVAAAARSKLAAKRVDLVVANDVSRSDIGMQSEDNEVQVFARDREPVFLGKRPKDELAVELVALFAEHLEARGG